MISWPWPLGILRLNSWGLHIAPSWPQNALWFKRLFRSRWSHQNHVVNIPRKSILVSTATTVVEAQKPLLHICHICASLLIQLVHTCHHLEHSSFQVSGWRLEEPFCKILLVTLRSSVSAKTQVMLSSSTLARNIGGEVASKASPFSVAWIWWCSEMNLDELLMNLVVFNAFLGFTYICSRVLTVWVVDRYIYSLPCFPNHKTDFAGSVPVNVVTNRAKKACHSRKGDRSSRL